MKFFIFLFAILVVVSALAGCSVRRSVSRVNRDVSTTSMAESITVIRDTVIYIYPDTVVLEAEVAASDTSYLASRFAFSRAWYDGRLHHTLYNLPRFAVTVPDAVRITKITSSVTSEVEAVSEKETVIEKKKFLNDFFYYIGVMALLILIILLCLKLR